MKAELAETILKNIMDWDTGKVATEFNDIQIISEIKYDDYQQYTHGMRYVESLALWLRTFDTQEMRNLAYKFVKENLIFISEEEMMQLVSVAFDMYMKPILIEKTKQFCIKNNIENIEHRKKIWRYFRRSTLFLGLSDGSHMDYFRRQNMDLSNEQVFVHYDFSQDKASEMLTELEGEKEVNDIFKEFSELEPTFKTFFLLDDFTASGKSYIRKDVDDEKWHGKIHKFFKQLNQIGYIKDDIEVHIILYVATEKAISYIREQIELYKIDNKIKATILVNAIQYVEPNLLKETDDVYKLLKEDYENNIKKYKNSYVDKHFKKGDCTRPYLGFDACSLSLVLYHNTPNNSFPKIWYSWDNEHSLFPRITRHKEN